MNTKPETKHKSGLPRLLEIAGERKNLLILSGVLSIISTFLMFIPFVACYFIVAELLQYASNPAMSDMQFIRNWGLAAFAGLLAALVFFYGSTMASHISAFHILYSLRMRIAKHLACLPMGYHTRESSGAIKKILELSVEKIEGFIAHQIPDMVGAIFFPVILLGGMFILDWRLALATAVPVIGSFVLQSVVFYGSEGSNSVREYHNALEKMNAAGVEYVRGMPAVKVFGLTVNTFLSFRNSIISYRDFVVEYTKFCKRPYLIFLTILASLTSFILPVGLLLISGDPKNQAFALTLLLFLVLAPGFAVPIMKLMYLGGNMRLISEGVDRIDAILLQQPLLEPVEPKFPGGNSVVFDHVGFSYAVQTDLDGTEVLNNVSFIAPEGKITALVGPSGSGKSTIANLIPRFWDVQSGSIRIGGVDVREIGTDHLMKLVSFVFQDVHLFFDTIEENIRMGNLTATHEQVVTAAKLACCHDFIENLESGYQTRIGEGGTYLSGGEAQRVAIARAILKNAPILVLDEATAFADPENETCIQQGLSALMQGKTVIIIAHRLSTIREADQILVVDHGKIVEKGRHAVLLEIDGLYARMWRSHIDAGAWTLAGKDVMKVEAA